MSFCLSKAKWQVSKYRLIPDEWCADCIFLASLFHSQYSCTPLKNPYRIMVICLHKIDALYSGHELHSGFAEIPTPVGSQDVMSQMRDYLWVWQLLPWTQQVREFLLTQGGYIWCDNRSFMCATLNFSGGHAVDIEMDPLRGRFGSTIFFSVLCIVWSVGRVQLHSKF